MNAFPIAIPANCDGYEDGMTLRDYFAGQALAGIAADPSIADESQADLAKWAYSFADAMLEARGE
jgi:hypothetical protein